MWFSNSIPNTIGRRTPAGTFSTTSAGEQEISQMTFQTRPSHMTKRPDGTILYVETGTICCDGLLVGAGIGTITPSGQVQPGTDPGADQSTAPSIDVGTDGTLWIGYPGGCDGVVVFECSELWAGNSVVARNVTPTAVAGGSDGSGWFSDGYLTYVSPQRTLTRFQNPAAVPTGGIEVGDDGNLWFAKGNAIGRITPAGVVTTFTDPTISSPNALVLGPDGNIWFSNNGSASIGRITPAGAVTNYTGTGIDHPTDLAVAPDGGIWFVNQGNHTLGRIQALLPVPPRMAYPTPTTLVGNATFLIAAGAPGTTAIEFRVTGGALHNALVSGATDVGVYGWWGIWGTSTLPAGSYSVVALATDGAGNRGVSAPVTFVVDHTPPTTAVLDPTNNTTLSGTKAFDASATDDHGRPTKVEFLLNGTSVATAGLTVYGWIGVLDTRTKPNGTYTLRSRATDAAGNVGTSGPVTIKIKN